MKKDDLSAAADMLRKYVTAVETKLYWNMSTSEAKNEINEAKRLVFLLEQLAADCN